MTRLVKSADARSITGLILRLALVFAVIGRAANIVEALRGGTAGFLFSVACGVPVWFLLPHWFRDAPWPRFLAILAIAAVVGSLIGTGAESAFAHPRRCRHHPALAEPAARLHCIELRERGTAR